MIHGINGGERAFSILKRCQKKVFSLEEIYIFCFCCYFMTCVHILVYQGFFAFLLFLCDALLIGIFLFHFKEVKTTGEIMTKLQG